MTGLCTQGNNAVLVENASLVHDYLQQWKLLAECEDASPVGLLTGNATSSTARGLSGKLWFTPLRGQLDLGEMLCGAKDGILFLMFNPGPPGTLTSPSGQNYDPDLFIQGVLNQDPRTAKNPEAAADLRHGA